MQVDSFDWDGGNREKCRKHGVPISEIEALFRGHVRIAPSLKPDAAEERYVAVGRTANGRALFVAFTLRRNLGRQMIRPISARYMHRKEIEEYEKESSKAENR
jgi:uncharacterized DUF497 family protein